MRRIPAEAMREVEWALQRYEEELEAAGLARPADESHPMHARNFVRWLRGEFVPGVTPPEAATPD